MPNISLSAVSKTNAPACLLAAKLARRPKTWLWLAHSQQRKDRGHRRAATSYFLYICLRRYKSVSGQACGRGRSPSIPAARRSTRTRAPRPWVRRWRRRRRESARTSVSASPAPPRTSYACDAFLLRSAITSDSTWARPAFACALSFGDTSSPSWRLRARISALACFMVESFGSALMSPMSFW